MSETFIRPIIQMPPDGVVDEFYSFTFVKDYENNYTYTIDEGSDLPGPGLTLYSNGTLEGIPSQKFITQFRIRAENSDTQQVSKQEFWMVVHESNSLPTVTAEFSQDINFNNNVVKFRDLSYGAKIVKWVWDFGDSTSSSEQNPTHIYIDKQQYTVLLEVWDEFNRRAEYEQDINLLETNPGIDCDVPQPRETICCDPIPPVNYYLDEGDLPLGLELSSVGEIFGEVSELASGNHPFTVRMVVNEGQENEEVFYKNFSIEVKEKESCLNFRLDDQETLIFPTNSYTEFIFETKNGIPPIKVEFIEKIGSALPKGMVFSDGRLFGIPSEDYEVGAFTLRAVGQSIQSCCDIIEKEFSFEVNNAPIINAYPYIPCVAPGQLYPKFRMEADGGTLPLRWSTPDSKFLLPNGLSLNPISGEITGSTDVAEGTYYVKFRVEDAIEQTDDFTTTINISSTCEETVYSELEPDLNFVRIPSPPSTPIVVGNRFFRNNLKNYLPDIY